MVKKKYIQLILYALISFIHGMICSLPPILFYIFIVYKTAQAFVALETIIQVQINLPLCSLLCNLLWIITISLAIIPTNKLLEKIKKFSSKYYSFLCFVLCPDILMI